MNREELGQPESEQEPQKETEKITEQAKPVLEQKQEEEELSPKYLEEINKKKGADSESSVEEIERLRTEIECRYFIESNKKKIPDALIQLVKGCKFVLVGEGHLSEAEPIRQEVAKSLAELQKEGLTHVALEVDSNKQELVDSLDYSDPSIRNILKKSKLGLPGWFDGNFDILIEAKRLGLKVQLIDYSPEAVSQEKKDTALFQNLRDSRMFDMINSETNKESKILVFIGSRHVHKKPVDSFNDGKVKRLGARLMEEYGDEQVASIRFVAGSTNFDNLPSFMSKTPFPEELYNKQNEPVILPDKGPIKGDERVSATDYIITMI